MTRLSLFASATLTFAAVLVVACAPLTEVTIRLGAANAYQPSELARVSVDLAHPVLVQGLDGELLSSVGVPSALRNWNYLLSPGDHLLWVVGAPYGNPLIPQRLRCYALRATFEPGRIYTLSEDMDAKIAVVRREDIQATVAASVPVDNPLVMERQCKWP